MTPKEQQAFADFVRAHTDCRKRPKLLYSGPKHQFVEMKVVQTGIAPAYVVTCHTCRETEDLSDYENW